MAANSRVEIACERHFNHHSDNCSGFVKAVAQELGVILSGQANDIVEQIQRLPWSVLSSGSAAAQKAAEGALVVAGHKHAPNGHVAVVVAGELSHGKYPTGYWGKLGGKGHQKTTLNYAWDAGERDSLVYSYVRV